jgi:hypothetical protein
MKWRQIKKSKEMEKLLFHMGSHANNKLGRDYYSHKKNIMDTHTPSCGSYEFYCDWNALLI